MDAARQFIIRYPDAFARLQPGSALRRAEELAELMSVSGSANAKPQCLGNKAKLKLFVFESIKVCPQLLFWKPQKTMACLGRIADSFDLPRREQEAMDMASSSLFLLTDYIRDHSVGSIHRRIVEVGFLLHRSERVAKDVLIREPRILSLGSRILHNRIKVKHSFTINAPHVADSYPDSCRFCKAS